MKLNLACSRDIKEGYVNLDLRSLNGTKVDILANALYLPFQSNVFEEIYCCNFLEHLSYKELLPALREMKRVLQLGGVLKLCVPDFSRIAYAWLHCDRMRKIDWWNWAIFGGQVYPDDIHRCALDEDVMCIILKETGFTSVSFSYDTTPGQEFWLWMEVY